MSYSANLHEKFLVAVETLGREAVNELFDKALSGDVQFDNPLVQKVVLAVSQKMNITAYEIVNGSGRKNHRKYAIGFCCFYLIKNYEVDADEVAQYLKKDTSLCYKYLKDVTNLNGKLISERMYYEIKMEFDDLFTKSK